MCCVACCRLCVMRSRSARGPHTSSPGRFARARPANDTGATGGCRGRCNYAGPWSRDRVSDAETHVNVLHQLLVGRLVLLQDVVVDAAARERRPEQEAEEAARRLVSIGPRGGNGAGGSAYPPRNAPTGLRTGSAGAASASRTRAELWKLREARAAGADALGSVRRPDVRIRDAIASRLGVPK